MSLDRRELLGELPELFLAALDGRQAEMWTAMPATVISFDPVKRTVAAQLNIQARHTLPNGDVETVTITPLLDCPVIFPGGKGMALTFPLEEGDEVTIIFSSRCIDYWWDRGGIQEQAEFRMHDISDGFCLPQTFSRPIAESWAPVALDAAELRTQNGSSVLRLKTNGDIEAVTPGVFKVEAGSVDVAAASIALNAPAIAMNGNVAIVGTFSVNGVDIGEHHAHGNVVTGPNNTGGVVP